MSELKNLICDLKTKNLNYEETLKTAPYNLIIKHDGPYVLYKYNQLNANYTLKEVREARGIIIREDTNKIVCYPFEKFGNYGESYCPKIDWSSAIVEQKIDGSLIKFWYDDNSWHISTNGTIDAYKAEISNCSDINSFGDVADLAIKNAGLTKQDFFKNLSPDYTYMFELVSPYTKVVIPYETTELYFLGLRNCISEMEYSIEDKDCNIPSVEFIKQYFKIPKRYPLSNLDEVVEAASSLPWNEEGYVVCDKYFNRVKIKSPEYVKAHYIATRGCVSDEKLAQVIIDGEIDEFLVYCPDYKDRIERLLHLRGVFYERVVMDRSLILHRYHPENRKEWAEIVNRDYPAYERPYLFTEPEKLSDKIYAWSANKYVEVIDNFLKDDRLNKRQGDK